MFENIINNLKDLIRGEVNKLRFSNSAEYKQLKQENRISLELQGKIASFLVNNKRDNINSIHDTEFKVYSQFGDDGIIQYLINKVDIKNNIFIEFGVENYQEANTRFLLFSNNWSGLILDGSNENIEFVQKSDFFWQYDLKAKSAFITKENINDLIRESGITGEIGILSIDIDGNDFWIWKEINVVNPDIVIIEYNSVFGKDRLITVPYNPMFFRTAAHFSNLYYGCSLPALCQLGEEKGYVFVGANSAGNNAYFVKKEKAGKLRTLSLAEGFVDSKFKESRNQKNELTLVASDFRQNIIKGLPVYNVLNDVIEAF